MELSTLAATAWITLKNAAEQIAHLLHACIDYIGVGSERLARDVLHMRTHGYYIAPYRIQAGKDVLFQH
ncbi:MAG TPA: hypothetical protein VFS24_15340 [Steroidobacteraceae bacterium]|nr:hypothetical protein [Steroidobacteraceae bacterium]